MDSPSYRTTPVPSTQMPTGIPYIIGNELAERFSFYGMKAVLPIVMTKYLLDSEGNRVPVSDEEARSYVHGFIAAAYFLPIFGAILSDWLLGKYRTIMSLSMFYCLGHAALAVDTTRFWMTFGLTLIAIGAGGIKPCVSAHVGDQFGTQNAHLLSKVFGWFYVSINLGAAISSMLTPWLLANLPPRYAPHVAFGLPGVLMFLATWVFWLGRNEFVHIPPGGPRFLRETFSGDGLRAILNLAPLFLFVAVFWSLFDQKDTAWVLQAENMDRRFGIHWLSAQLQAINPLLILVFVPLFNWVVYPAFDLFFPLTPLRKIALGFFLIIPGFAIPGWLETQITGGRIARFKDAAGAELDKAKFQSASSANPEFWAPRNLLDGRIDDGTGWVSAKRKGAPTDGGDDAKARPAFFPQSFAIELRERRAWKIAEIRLHPQLDMARFLASVDDAGKESLAKNTAGRCAPKEVEAFVGMTPVGPWTSVGKLALNENVTPETLSFPPVEARFVRVRIDSNHGGDYVCLGEVEVFTNEPLPADAAPRAKDVYPNVAATGHLPPIIWQILAIAIVTASEVLVSITCLEFAYTQAPKTMKSFIVSFYLLSVALGNEAISIVNQHLENPDGTSRLPGATYYWVFTGAMVVTAVLFVVFSQFYRGRTYIQGEGEAEESTGT